MDSMATEAEIDRVMEAAADYILTRYLEIGVADADVRLVRDHVGATLMYLAESSLRIGCYDLLDDLIQHLAGEEPWPRPS